MCVGSAQKSVRSFRILEIYPQTGCSETGAHMPWRSTGTAVKRHVSCGTARQSVKPYVQTSYSPTQPTRTLYAASRALLIPHVNSICATASVHQTRLADCSLHQSSFHSERSKLKSLDRVFAVCLPRNISAVDIIVISDQGPHAGKLSKICIGVWAGPRRSLGRRGWGCGRPRYGARNTGVLAHL